MKSFRKIFTKEVSTFSRYFDKTYLCFEPKTVSPDYASHIDSPSVMTCETVEEFPDLSGSDEYGLFLLDGVSNYSQDIHYLLKELSNKSNRQSRMALIAYNSYLRWLFVIANILGIRKGPLPKTFLTKTAVENLAKISGWEVVKFRPLALCPIPFLFIDKLINWVTPMFPFLGWFSLATLIVFRPVKPDGQSSLSIVIPARNEEGNIENALKRIENLKGEDVEVIFVEGHSQDNTWQEIQRVAQAYRSDFQIKFFQQTGKGKNDAVRMGFDNAEKDLLVIQDADLTVEPEFLIRFLKIYREGHADFINGNRLTLPMEKEAMRTLNFFGNLFFAKVLNHTLALPIGDSLCGTKMLSKKDYQRIVRWRKDFGDFDPFGDFELLFGTSVLGLGSVDVPVFYRAREYGATNISRFAHGWMLLKMTVVGLFRIKAGKV